MRRREFVRLGSAAIVATGLSTTGLQNTAKAEDGKVEPSSVGNPVLFHPDVDRISVAWRVHQVSNGRVEYGTTRELGQTAVSVRHGLRQKDNAALLVDLVDLKPDTTYHYRTVTTSLDFAGAYHKNVPNRGTPHRSEIYRFRTPPARSDSTSFAVINDTHGNMPVIHGLFARIKAKPTDAVFWNGDIYDYFTPESAVRQTLDVLGPKGYATQVPVVFVYGNHDVRGEYAMDLEKMIPTREGRRYFTFQNGPVRFMVLDTGEDKPDSHKYLQGLTDFARYRSEQREWIAGEIGRREWKDAKFRVVICHIPLFGGGACPDGRNKWHDLLTRGKADLMISGHTHRPAFHGPDGSRPYALLVGGGPKHHQARIIRGRVEGERLELTMETMEGKPAGNWTIRSRS